MKKGFTLAELMAVVVILAIIASIGLGGYKRTVERAKFAEVWRVRIMNGMVLAAALIRRGRSWILTPAVPPAVRRWEPIPLIWKAALISPAAVLALW